jgi:hypothetical protein
VRCLSPPPLAALSALPREPGGLLLHPHQRRRRLLAPPRDLGCAVENNVKLLPRTQHGDPFLGMVTAMEARCTMRPYLRIVALIVGLVGAYLALLPLSA